jgi:hypothetical protein
MPALAHRPIHGFSEPHDLILQARSFSAGNVMYTMEAEREGQRESAPSQEAARRVVLNETQSFVVTYCVGQRFPPGNLTPSETLKYWTLRL